MLGSFNNGNIIKNYNKTTTSEDFEDILQFILDRISDNMALLVQYGKYGVMNTYSTIMDYYVIKFVSE